MTEEVTAAQPLQPGELEPESYAFVMNVARLTDADSHTLAPGHELRRARTKEIIFIKNALKDLAPIPHNRFHFLWEKRLSSPGGRVEQLPENEWRYFVIAFKGANSAIIEIENAFDLSNLELEIGFTVVAAGGGFGTISVQGRLFHVLEQTNDSFFVDVSAADIEGVKAIYSELKLRDSRLIDTQRLVLQLSQLKGLPHRSPLRFLGYFALLESLLTHDPKRSDPYDSITRQVEKN